MASCFVEKTVPNRDIFQGLFECECHPTTDDQTIDFPKQVVNQLDLVRDLCTTEDCKEWSFGVLKSLCEVVEFFLHEKARRLLWQFDTNHGAVGTVSGPKSVVCSSQL